MKGLKLVLFLSSEDMIQIESPRQEGDLNHMLYNDTDLDSSLVQRSRPDSLDLGIVSPVFKGVTKAFAVIK